MLSNLTLAWRTVRKRLAADWLVVIAAFTTIVLATVLLSSGPIYADAVTSSALQRSLEEAPVTDSNIEISLRVLPEYYETADRLVRDTVTESLQQAEPTIYGAIEADAYEIVGASNEDIVALAAIQHLEEVESKASLTSGSWPADGTFSAALNAPAAESLGVSEGETIQLVNRRDGSSSTIEVSGIFKVTDVTDAYWFADDLAAAGFADSASFRSFGPFLVSQDTALRDFTPLRVNASWRVLPDFTEIDVGEVDVLRANVTNLASRLDSVLFEAVDVETAGASDFVVNSGLSALLAGMDRSLTVTRSSVLAVLIQMAILAGYALVLTAGLLVDTRRAETALLRSRGTSPRQILTTSVVEGVVLTVPAALIAPWLATWLLRLLNSYGPLATIQLEIDPAPTAEAYLLAGIAAALSIVALAWPAYRAARAFPSSTRRHDRQTSQSTTQRVGIDVALIAIAVLAFWQLQELGPEISARVRGQFGVDPLLVMAPALGLVAGAILGLRVVPALARIAEWIASSRRTAVPALASWQVARRPARYARSSLLLMMAIGIGFFAASYSTTWISSQEDQAAHEVGADLRVTPDRAAGSSLPDLQLAATHESLDGVSTSMPVLEITGSLSSQGGPGQFVILDAAKAAEVVAIRDDESPDFRSLMETLTRARPAIGAIDLPGEPSAIGLTFEATELIPEDREQCGPEAVGPETCFDAIVRVVVQDGNEQLHRIDVGPIPENEGVVTLWAPLSDEQRPATYPLRLVSIEFETRVAVTDSREVSLKLGPILVEQHDGLTEDVQADLNWESWQPTVGVSVGVQSPPAITPDRRGTQGRLEMTVETGQGWTGAPPVYLSLRPDGTELTETFPVVVTESFVDTNFTAVGEEVRLPPLRIGRDTGEVVGTVRSFPTIDKSRGETIILDLPTYQMLGYEPGFGLSPVDSYWLEVEGFDEGTVEALQAAPISSFDVASTGERTDTLVSDPVALGTIGSLTVGFIAAAVFAAVGFAVSAIVSARERMTEFALLRAVGLSPRQLGSWLAMEQAALVIVSLGLGTLIGWVLTAALLPLVTLTQDGGPAVPEVIVEYPWTAIVGLQLAVVLVLGIIVTGLTLLLRRVGLGSLLRLGED